MLCVFVMQHLAILIKRDAFNLLDLNRAMQRLDSSFFYERQADIEFTYARVVEVVVAQLIVDHEQFGLRVGPRCEIRLDHSHILRAELIG